MAGSVGGELKNQMIKKAGELATFISLGKAGTEKTPTEVNLKTLKVASPPTVNSVFVIKAGSLAGGLGLKEGRMYFVTKVTGEEIEFSMREGGPVEEWTTVITGIKIIPVEEIKVKSPTLENRIATVWGSPLKGAIVDSTAHAFKVPASTITFLLYYDKEKVAEGELKALAEVATPETLGAEGTYTVTESKWDDLATA